MSVMLHLILIPKIQKIRTGHNPATQRRVSTGLLPFPRRSALSGLDGSPLAPGTHRRLGVRGRGRHFGVVQLVIGEAEASERFTSITIASWQALHEAAGSAMFVITH